MRKRVAVTRQGNLERSSRWAGVQAGDAVVVDGLKERRQQWVFVAHVRNVATQDEWVEVRGGRSGEAKAAPSAGIDLPGQRKKRLTPRRAAALPRSAAADY